ncbi:hypothetical protein D9M69_341610 [compost metagenome]
MPSGCPRATWEVPTIADRLSRRFRPATPGIVIRRAGDPGPPEAGSRLGRNVARPGHPWYGLPPLLP